MNYIIQKVKTKTGKKMIMVYEMNTGVLMATKVYHFNYLSEAIEPLKLQGYFILMEELTIESKDFNFYKKYENLL